MLRILQTPRPSATSMAVSKFDTDYPVASIVGLLGNKAVQVIEGLYFGAELAEVGIDTEFTADNALPAFNVTAGSIIKTGKEIRATAVPARMFFTDKVYTNGAKLSTVALTGSNQKLLLSRVFGTVLFSWLPLTGAYTNGLGNIAGSTTAATNGTVNTIEIADDAIILKRGNSSLLSIPRTFQMTSASGAVATLSSSGVAVGSVLPSSSIEKIVFVSAGATTLTLLSNTGESQVYPIVAGTAMALVDGTLHSVPQTITVNSGSSFNVPLAAVTGGVGNITREIKTGNFPEGVSASNIALVGNVSTEGDYTGSYVIQDAFGQSIEVNLLLRVRAAENSVYNPPPALVDEAYNYLPEFSGDVTSVALVGGVLPNGITLNTTTGRISGIATAPLSSALSILTTFANSTTDTSNFTFNAYNRFAVTVSENTDTPISLPISNALSVNLTDELDFKVAGGSGQFTFSLNNGNLVSSSGAVRFFNVGETLLKITDVNTRQSLVITITVSGQKEACAFNEVNGLDEMEAVSCPDIVTTTRDSVTVAFRGLTLVENATMQTERTISANFTDAASLEVKNNGTEFASAVSLTTNASARIAVARLSNPIVKFAVTRSLSLPQEREFALGIVQKGANVAPAAMRFSVVLTTIDGTRRAEVRENNLYQAGSRVTVGEGDIVALGFVGGSLGLYVNGINTFMSTLPSEDYSNFDFGVWFQAAGMTLGGKVQNLLYSMVTQGTADRVGVVDSETGEYTPAENNIATVVVQGNSDDDSRDVSYRATIQIVRPALRLDQNKFVAEGTDVDLYVSLMPPTDNKPTRLAPDGSPDLNQNPETYHVGILQNELKITHTPQTTEFKHDRGNTSTSHRVMEAMVEGNYLAVRSYETAAKLIPFFKKTARGWTQFSTGCHDEMRVIVVVKNNNCHNTNLFEVMTFDHVKSYATFDVSYGASVQSTVVLKFKATPDGETNAIWTVNSFDAKRRIIA